MRLRPQVGISIVVTGQIIAYATIKCIPSKDFSPDEIYKEWGTYVEPENINVA